MAPDWIKEVGFSFSLQMNHSISQWIKIESSDKPRVTFFCQSTTLWEEKEARGKGKVTLVLLMGGGSCFLSRSQAGHCPLLMVSLAEPLTWWFFWVTAPCNQGDILLMSKCACSVKLQNTGGIWTQSSTKKKAPQTCKIFKNELLGRPLHVVSSPQK